MAENVIYVRGTRAQVRQKIMTAVQSASGRMNLAREAVEGMQTRIGLVALGYIRDAFVEKARGGTDAAGLKWKPLSRKTIAYSRRHAGVPRRRPGSRPSWMLTKRQNDRWWHLYRQGLAIFKGDASRAARRAWAILKSEGAKTLIGTYGDASVEILRDTGLLLNSLSPGVPGNVPDQIFRTGAGEVIIGTNRKGAARQHKTRPLWPDPADWPDAWWEDIEATARTGMIDILIYLLTRGN